MYTIIWIYIIYISWIQEMSLQCDATLDQVYNAFKIDVECSSSAARDKSGDGFPLRQKSGRRSSVAGHYRAQFSLQRWRRNNNTVPAETNKSGVPPVACGSGRCFAFALAI